MITIDFIFGIIFGFLFGVIATFAAIKYISNNIKF